MNYTLHKLPEGFIVTSDEEIKENDIGFDGLHIFKCLNPFIANETTTGKNIPCFYIELGETSAFHESSYIKKVIAQQDQIDFSSLSEEKQKEIGYFDIDNELNKLLDKDENLYSMVEPMSYKSGFKKAQELLSDRRFTLEDMKNLMHNSIIFKEENQHLSLGEYAIKNKEWFDKYIQSLSQPKSWKVELEMENCTASALLSGYIPKPKLTKGKIKILKLL